MYILFERTIGGAGDGEGAGEVGRGVGGGGVLPAGGQEQGAQQEGAEGPGFLTKIHVALLSGMAWCDGWCSLVVFPAYV